MDPMRRNRFATLCATFALAPTLTIAHPLDGLTGAEMLRVTQIDRQIEKFRRATSPRGYLQGLLEAD